MKNDNRLDRNNRLHGKCLTCLLAVYLTISATALAGEQGSYQRKVLFDPDPATLQAEASGRIMIYDGLDSEEVDQALDGQFERIENMMFIRTREQQENGEYEVDEDC